MHFCKHETNFCYQCRSTHIPLSLPTFQLTPSSLRRQKNVSTQKLLFCKKAIITSYKIRIVKELVVVSNPNEMRLINK